MQERMPTGFAGRETSHNSGTFDDRINLGNSFSHFLKEEEAIPLTNINLNS